jgi:hypothetical protein
MRAWLVLAAALVAGCGGDGMPERHRAACDRAIEATLSMDIWQNLPEPAEPAATYDYDGWTCRVYEQGEAMWARVMGQPPRGMPCTSRSTG